MTKPTSEEELLPCPWCSVPAAYTKEGKWHRVSCGEPFCGVHPETQWRESKNQAVEAWNTRAILLAELIEVARAANNLENIATDYHGIMNARKELKAALSALKERGLDL